MRNEMIFTVSHDLRIKQLEEDILSLQASKQGLQQEVIDLRDRLDDLTDNLEKVRLKVTKSTSKPGNAYDLNAVAKIQGKHKR